MSILGTEQGKGFSDYLAETVGISLGKTDYTMDDLTESGVVYAESQKQERILMYGIVGLVAILILKIII
jgi:hypothetical protein